MSAKLVMSKQPGHGLFMRITEKKKSQAEPLYPPVPSPAEQERDILQKHVKMVEKRCSTLSTQLALEVEAKAILKLELDRLDGINKILAEDKRSALESVDLLSEQVKDFQEQTACIPELHEKLRLLSKADHDNKERIVSMKRQDEDWKLEVNELLRECAALRRDLSASEQEKQVVKTEAAKLLCLFEKETQENLRNQERLFETTNAPTSSRTALKPKARLSRKDEEIEAIRNLI